MKHAESKLQQECVKWFGLAYPKYAKLLFAIPNGGARDRITGAILKAEGVVAGVPDLMLAVNHWLFNGLFIEMKTKTGNLTPSQATMIDLLTEQGYAVTVCHSFDEFKQNIEQYLRNE